MRIKFVVLLALSLLPFGFFAQKGGLAQQFQTNPPNFQVELPIEGWKSCKEDDIRDLYTNIKSNKEVRTFAKALHRFGKHNQLTGYFLLVLIDEYFENHFPLEQVGMRTVFKHIVLREIGYDSRLYHNRHSVYLVVHSSDAVTEVTFINDSNRRFYVLDGLGDGIGACVPLVDLNPKGGSMLRMIPDAEPQFSRPKLILREFSFVHEGKEKYIKVMGNQSYVEYLKAHPTPPFQSFPKIPVSNSVQQSIIPGLRQMTSNMETRTAINLLLAFTSTAIGYEEDLALFGSEEYAGPDRLLIEGTGDCEDKTFLMYFLVKELLNLEMVFIEYPNHLLLGVQIDGEGYEYNHQNRKFLACDPTGHTRGSYRLGERNEELRFQAYEILEILNEHE